MIKVNFDIVVGSRSTDLVERLHLLCDSAVVPRAGESLDFPYMGQYAKVFTVVWEVMGTTVLHPTVRLETILRDDDDAARSLIQTMQEHDWKI